MQRVILKYDESGTNVHKERCDRCGEEIAVTATKSAFTYEKYKICEKCAGVKGNPRFHVGKTVFAPVHPGVPDSGTYHTAVTAIRLEGTLGNLRYQYRVHGGPEWHEEDALSTGSPYGR